MARKKSKKKKKTLENILVTIVALAVLSLMFFFLTSQSVFGSNDLKIRTYEDERILPTAKGTFDLGEYSGTYESTFIGNVVSNGQPGGYYIDQDSDSDIAISNDFTDGETLTIRTFIANNDNSNANKNAFTITLPAGQIIYTCQGDLFSKGDKCAEMKCGVLGLKEIKVSSDVREGSDEFVKTFSETSGVILEKETEVTFYTRVNGCGESSQVNGVLTAEFIPLPEGGDLPEEVEEVSMEEIPATQVENQTEDNAVIRNRLLGPAVLSTVLAAVLVSLILIRRRK